MKELTLPAIRCVMASITSLLDDDSAASFAHLSGANPMAVEGFMLSMIRALLHEVAAHRMVSVEEVWQDICLQVAFGQNESEAS